MADAAVLAVIEPLADLRRSPAHDAPLDTQALFGERIYVDEMTDEGWVHGKLESDGYVGWLSANALAAPERAPTHKIRALRTLAFPAPDIKTPPLAGLPLGSRLAIAREDDRFAITTGGWYVPRSHVAPLDAYESDFVAVAERFLGTPYLWGGKTSLGLDCSGLVQVSLQAVGIECPRDSHMQEAALGRTISLGDLRRGDLIFWPGHVAIARDVASLIHANAHHMAVAIEPVVEAITRIKAAGSEVRTVRRLA